MSEKSQQVCNDRFSNQFFFNSRFFTILFISREIIETMVGNYRTAIFQDRNPVFDGRKNLYTAQPLPIDNQKVNLTLVFLNLGSADHMHPIS